MDAKIIETDGGRSDISEKVKEPVKMHRILPTFLNSKGMAKRAPAVMRKGITFGELIKKYDTVKKWYSMCRNSTSMADCSITIVGMSHSVNIEGDVLDAFMEGDYLAEIIGAGWRVYCS